MTGMLSHSALCLAPSHTPIFSHIEHNYCVINHNSLELTKGIKRIFPHLPQANVPGALKQPGNQSNLGHPDIIPIQSPQQEKSISIFGVQMSIKRIINAVVLSLVITPFTTVTAQTNGAVVPVLFLLNSGPCDGTPPSGDVKFVDMPFGFENRSTATADPKANHSGVCVVWVDQQNLDGSPTDFTLDASTTAANEKYATRDIFLFNTLTNELTRITDPGATNVNLSNNIEAASPVISDDGLKIAYVQETIGAGSITGTTLGDVFVRNMASPDLAPVKVNITENGSNAPPGTPISNSERGGVAGDRGNSSLPVVDISGNGTRVVFVTGQQLTASDSNFVNDVYMRDVSGGTTTLISIDEGVATGTTANVKISRDGRYVAFSSFVDYTDGELTGGSLNSAIDLYLRDTVTNAILLVSSVISGQVFEFDMSADASRIAYATNENSNLDDINGLTDIYVADVDLSSFTVNSRQRVSEADARFELRDGRSFSPTINAAGNRVAFMTEALDMAPYEGSFPVGDDFGEALYIIDLESEEIFRPDQPAVKDGSASLTTNIALAGDAFYYREVVNALPSTNSASSDTISTGVPTNVNNVSDIPQGDGINGGLLLGETIRGVINSASDIDVYQYHATNNDTLSVTIQGVDSNGGTLGDPIVTVQEKFSPSLFIAVSNGDGGVATDDDSGFGRDSFTNFTNDGGIRYISVSSSDGGTGSYRLHIGAQDTPLPESILTNSFSF